MEVKPGYLCPKGYKQTEVGVIPEEWDVAQISDVCQLVNGRGFKPFEWQTTGLPIIRIQNLNGSEDFNYYSGQYNPKILVEPGQLLFAWSGSRGTSFGPHVWNGGRALLNYHTWKVVVNESSVTPDFLLYALRQLTSYIEDRAHGASALVHTQKWEMEKFPVVLPASLPEQRAIATALSDVDGLLGGLVRLIAKKRDLKQAAMQQLLTGQTRLPGFHGEWEVKRLGDVAMLKNGYAFKSDTYTSLGTFKVITIANVQDGYMTADACNTIASEPADLQTHQRLRRGDILISMTGNVGRVCRVDEDHCLLNQRVGKLVPVGGIVEALLFVLLGQPSFISAMTGVAKGGAQPNLSASDITEHTFNIPKDAAEQTAIAEVLTEMDAELAGLTQRREKTRALKQAMMQELLTGRVRLVSGELKMESGE